MRCNYAFIVFLMLPFLLPAQTYVGNIILRTQADVDSFALHYPPMSRLFGGLQLGELTGSDIHDLSFLPRFSAINELLIIGTQLISLESFAGVDSTYRCRVMHNPLLQDLRGLHHLKYNAEYLVLYKNSVLGSLTGLDSLQYTDGHIIEGNDELHSLEGALQLEKVAELKISNNKRLKTLTGLPVLWNAFSLTVEANDSLEHFGGFPQLTSLYSMTVRSNSRLKDFAGFNNGFLLPTGYVAIQDNPALESLAGLEHLTKAAVLYITGNHRLRQVLHLDHLTYASPAYISGDLIDTIHFPALQKGYFQIYKCPSLVRLHNVFPVADSLKWEVFDNPALLTIHEDAGPKKMPFFFVGNNPLLRSVTGFDSTLICAERDLSGNIRGVAINSGDDLKEVVGFRNVRFGNLTVGKYDATRHLDRVEGFDHMETALGGLVYGFNNNSTEDLEQRGPRVVQGFQGLRRCIDGNLSLVSTIQDTLIGFQMLDSIVGRSSYASIGWVDTCYVDPAAFAQWSYTEGSVTNGGLHGRPWPVPILNKIYRNVLNLSGDPQPTGFEGLFPALKTVGAVFAWSTNISSLRGLAGITRFDRVELNGSYIHLEDNPNLEDCSAVCSWLENASFHPPTLNDQTIVITNNPLFPCTDKATLLSWCDTVTAVQAPLPTAADGAKAGELLVYPNPVQQGLIHFRLPESALGTTFQVSVYDLQGRAKVIRTDRFTTDYAVPVGDWPTGTYILQVQTKEQVWAATVQVGP